jgi:hypothetical protein
MKALRIVLYYTVHTARRSFATNGYLEGVPTISLMEITGFYTRIM